MLLSTQYTRLTVKGAPQINHHQFRPSRTNELVRTATARAIRPRQLTIQNVDGAVVIAPSGKNTNSHSMNVVSPTATMLPADKASPVTIRFILAKAGSRLLLAKLNNYNLWRYSEANWQHACTQPPPRNDEIATIFNNMTISEAIAIARRHIWRVTEEA